MYTRHASINRKQTVYSAVHCLVTENTTELAKSETRDFFVWTKDKVEILLTVNSKYKVVENRLGGDTSERYQEHYPSPEEGMAMGME